MHKQLKTIILTAAAACALTACDSVASDDRYIPVESLTAQRTVIVEDFTGQKCVNCPAAHVVLEELTAQWGDAVIPVSIHAGSFGIAADYTRYTGLMQPEGNTYNDAWGITEWPKGVVNRQYAPSNHDLWATQVREALKAPARLDIGLTASLTPDSMIDITTTLRPQADIPGAKLQIWVIEDSIVARQWDIDRGTINDYVHNHVYRASVNGVGGEDVALSADQFAPSTLSHTIALRRTATERWRASKISVVAFVYTSAGVEQAAKAHLNL